MSAAQNISLTVQSPAWIAGILLVSSFLILLLALIILIASGAFPAFSAGLQGSLAEKAPYAAIFRLLNLFWTVGWIVQLLGFALLTRLLLRAGDEFLGILVFTAVFIAAILGVLHGTFHMSVETWAAQEAARAGSLPEAYEPLMIWIGSAFRIAYILHLLSTAGFGWSILRVRLLEPWLGWISISWGILWLLSYLVGAGAPGLLFIMPAVIGVTLLRKGTVQRLNGGYNRIAA
jgi:hypothetical protein